jgi:enamine deaminase RidA (YjgF/YER057c/UK114 family)
MSQPSVEDELRKRGIELPAAPPAVGAYVPAIRCGNLIVTSGQLPWKEGKLAYTGKLGAEVTLEQGYEAARLCAINALAQIKALLGDLQKVRQIVRLEGYVHCAAGFRQHPQVLNGASELLNAVFGERGRHTRTALGIHEMPLDAAVQLVVWADVE